MKHKLFFTIIILIIINVYLHKNNVEYFKQQENSLQKYITQSIENQLKNIIPELESRGSYTNKGYIRSVKYPNYFIKRTANGIKLDRRKFESQYIWTHNSDGKLTNDNKSLDIIHNKIRLNSLEKAGSWEYDETKQQMKYNNDKCLSVTQNNDKEYILDVKKCNHYDTKQYWTFF